MNAPFKKKKKKTDAMYVRFKKTIGFNYVYYYIERFMLILRAEHQKIMTFNLVERLKFPTIAEFFSSLSMFCNFRFRTKEKF